MYRRLLALKLSDAVAHERTGTPTAVMASRLLVSLAGRIRQNAITLFPSALDVSSVGLRTNAITILLP